MTVHPRSACSSAYPSAEPEHPIDTLVAEHRVILAVLDAMERGAQKLGTNEVSPLEFWRRVVLFLEHFADHCHHGKEEDLLFPELVRAGLPAEHGPVGVMKHEHVEGRALRGRIEHALSTHNSVELNAAVHAYLPLLREHIDKENEVLFPMARDMLAPEQAAGLGARFARFEREHMGEGTHCLWLSTARDLCREAGVPAPD